MLEKNIKFKAPKQYLDLKQQFPEPIKLNIPEWYKKLKHNYHDLTIKGCMPFLDSLTTGYLLRLPQDFYLDHNYKDGDNYTSTLMPSLVDNNNCNLNTKDANTIHSPKQFDKSPMAKKNNHFPAFKIMNPWTIVTPDNYSCLFLPPMNNTDDRFSIIPAIVNTDTYNQPINFPIIVNGDKYPVQQTTLKKGTPYVQVIPYKRQSWKMNIEEQTDLRKEGFDYALTLLNKYKSKFWKKVTWR